MADVDWEALFQAAAKAREQAYAPYSRFSVGAAVMAEDGTLYAGCNVENASYGLSMCAERNAVGRMVVEGRRRLVAVAIVVDTARPTPPCGACRQVLIEHGAPDVPLRSRNLQGAEDRSTLFELLPNAFTKDHL